MEINFPEDFRQELSGKLEINPDDVTDTLTSPDKTDQITMGDLSIHIASRRIPQIPSPYYLLTYGQVNDDRLQVNMAWKLSPDLHPDIERVSPLNLLEVFAREYGLKLRIGSKTSPFFLEETLYLTPEEWERGVEVQAPGEHQYVQQTFLKTERDEQGRRVDCALAYCIDIDRYRGYKDKG